MSSINTIVNGSIISINFRNFSSDEMSLAFSQALRNYRNNSNPVYSDQIAEIFLGNPGDVSYEDRAFAALYLGTSGNCFGEPCHFWYVPSHNLICVTFASDSGRTTWARRIGDGPAECYCSPEQQLLLNTAFADGVNRRADRDEMVAYYSVQHA